MGTLNSGMLHLVNGWVFLENSEAKKAALFHFYQELGGNADLSYPVTILKKGLTINCGRLSRGKTNKAISSVWIQGNQITLSVWYIA